jgi:hypothetical protein
LPDFSGRLHLLRAFANGQKWHAPATSQAKRDALKTEIANDLRFAFTHGQRAENIRPFWDLSIPRSLGRDPNDGEDDLAGIVDAADIDTLTTTSPGPAQPH